MILFLVSESGFPEGGIFFPDIDIILWRRMKRDPPQLQLENQYEYLVKYKNYSYLQCEWIDEKEVYISYY